MGSHARHWLDFLSWGRMRRAEVRPPRRVHVKLLVRVVHGGPVHAHQSNRFQVRQCELLVVPVDTAHRYQSASVTPQRMWRALTFVRYPPEEPGGEERAVSYLSLRLAPCDRLLQYTRNVALTSCPRRTARAPTKRTTGSACAVRSSHFIRHGCRNACHTGEVHRKRACAHSHARCTLLPPRLTLGLSLGSHVVCI